MKHKTKAAEFWFSDGFKIPEFCKDEFVAITGICNCEVFQDWGLHDNHVIPYFNLLNT